MWVNRLNNINLSSHTACSIKQHLHYYLLFSLISDICPLFHQGIGECNVSHSFPSPSSSSTPQTQCSCQGF